MTNLIFPGQLVYTYDNFPGINLGVRELPKPRTNSYVYDVLRVDGESPDDYDIYSYDLDEVHPITVTTKDTLTGQKIEYGPFRKKQITTVLTEKEINENEAQYVKYLRGIRKQKWFKERYPETEALEPAKKP